MDYLFFFILNFINSKNLKYKKNIHIFAKNNLNTITMNYNKKQMQPLINKYGINVETNKLFIKVCELFDGQSNYQTWAVKMIFSQAMTFEQLDAVHEWIEANGNMINKLDKKNIVSYSSKTAVAQLLKEIEGIKRISFIKSIISHFNTDQRKILTDSILGSEVTPLEAYSNANIKKWYGILRSFNKKPMGIKNKFYSTCSALRSAESLHQAILDCLEKDYEWSDGKEGLLSYMEHNTKDCEVVFNEGNCVIVRVPSFKSSHKLCGSGRTGWCLSREESYFKSYVTSYPNRDQYFLFDFNRKETDAFAHIGFTIEGNYGVAEAQTCHNRPMKDVRWKQGDEELNIYDVFKKFGIDMSMFIRLPEDLGFKWDIDYIMDMISKNKESYAIAYNNDGRIIVNVLNHTSFREFTKKTFIHSDEFGHVNENNKIYLLMDFNLPIKQDKSLIAISIVKDAYGTNSLAKMRTILGSDITKDNYLSSIGISIEDFSGKEVIDPSILLHKYIEENNEKEAIKLIEKEGGNINVNYEFNRRVPIFSAMNNKMFNLFEIIVNHDSFDSKIEDGFGLTLLESLIYLIGENEVTKTKEDEKNLKTVINAILNSKNYDFNIKDINNDTAINMTCTFPSTLWVTKALVSNKNVDINIVNDFDETALGNCLKHKNLEALKLIGQRPDLVVREEDEKLAKANDINLKDYIHPSKSIFKEEAVGTPSEALELEFAEAL